MSTKIGLVSDVHASPVPLAQALAIFENENVHDIICAGDIAGYFETLAPTIELLRKYNCKTIIGNHDQAFLEENTDVQNSDEYNYLGNLPETLEYIIEGKRIYVVHAHPPNAQHGGIKLLDVDGNIIQEQKDDWENTLKQFNYDVIIVGHTHQVYAEQLGDVFVVNPGSTAFNHSCMILTLPELSVQTFALEGQEILKSWNFSMLFKHKQPYPPAKS